MKRSTSPEKNSSIKKIKSEREENWDKLSWEQNSPIKQIKSEREVYNENDLSFELHQLYSDAEACSIFRKLENEISYLDRDKAKIKIFGKEHRMPRSVAAYGDDNLSYTYSNFKMYAEPWTQTLKEIKKDVENATGSEYNFVLINRYQNGKDHMGAHKDDEKDLVKDYSIASVSLGQSRDFTFSRKSFPSVKITLENGSLLEMKHPTNTYWYHCLPRCEVKKPRINLTFRRMNPQKQNSPIKKIRSECKMFCESDLSFEQNSTVKKLKSEHEVYCKNDLSYELRQLYSDAKAYSIFRRLENEIKYLERDMAKIKIFGKEYRMPRSVAAYGDDNLSYKYSNFGMYAEPWTQTLKEIKKDVENATGSEYNFVLINKYENGKDHMGAHKDDEKDLVKDYSIASVSLGQSRAFTFSRKNFPSVKITLENGSLLEMKHPTNTFWYHCLPRCKVENPRINLTFRRMNPQEARK